MTEVADERIVSGAAASRTQKIIGAMRGSVLRHDSPFSPPADPSDWTTVDPPSACAIRRVRCGGHQALAPV